MSDSQSVNEKARALPSLEETMLEISRGAQEGREWVAESWLRRMSLDWDELDKLVDHADSMGLEVR
jgi:hypothetical protein